MTQFEVTPTVSRTLSNHCQEMENWDSISWTQNSTGFDVHYSKFILQLYMRTIYISYDTEPVEDNSSIVTALKNNVPFTNVYEWFLSTVEFYAMLIQN